MKALRRLCYDPGIDLLTACPLVYKSKQKKESLGILEYNFVLQMKSPLNSRFINAHHKQETVSSGWAFIRHWTGWNSLGKFILRIPFLSLAIQLKRRNSRRLHIHIPIRIRMSSSVGLWFPFLWRRAQDWCVRFLTYPGRFLSVRYCIRDGKENEVIIAKRWMNV